MLIETFKGPYYRQKLSDGTITLLSDYTMGSYNWPDTRVVGENIEDWRERISKCESATTFLSGSKASKVKHKHGYAEVQLSGYKFYLTGTIAACYPQHSTNALAQQNLASAILEADNRAKVKLLKRAHEVTTAFSGGVFLGELLETLRMLRSPAKALREGIGDYLSDVHRWSRQHPRATAKKVNSIINGAWLEYSFGFNPLLADVEDAAIALARLKHDHRLCVRVNGSGAFSKVHTYRNTRNIGYFKVDAISHVACKGTVRYYGAVKLNPTNRPQLSRKYFGFDAREFVPTVWELIPYSWLVDYFTNIGDILTSWSYGRADLSWCNRTERQEVVNSIDHVPRAAYAAYPLVKSKSGKLVTRKKDVIRNRYSGNFIPSFEWELPGVNSTKWLNIASLTMLKTLPTYHY